MNEPKNGKPPIWNLAVYQAARKSGCTKRQAEVLAVYVESAKLSVAADRLGISLQTAKNHMLAVRQKMKVKHIAGAVAKILA